MSAAKTERTICIAEDDAAVAALVSRIASKTGLRVVVSQTAEGALQLATSHSTELVIADVNLPEFSGPEMIKRLRASGVTCPVLFISGDPSLQTLDSSLSLDG